MTGWIHVITGPMFSGKTDVLLRIVRRQYYTGLNPILYTPSLDTRTEIVTSRSGATYTSFPISRSADVYQTLTSNYIAFDEAQFLDDFLPAVVEALANEGKYVLVSGLDRDFLKRPFGPMGEIILMADEITKLTAVCTICKGDATLTQRLVDGRPATANDPLILVGGMGDDTYEARCRAHHRIGE